jgi:hypothetical protein
MMLTKEQRRDLRLLHGALGSDWALRRDSRDDAAVFDARTGERIAIMGPDSSCDPADPNGWIAQLINAAVAFNNAIPSLLDTIDELERQRDAISAQFKATWPAGLEQLERRIPVE